MSSDKHSQFKNVFRFSTLSDDAKKIWTEVDPPYSNVGLGFGLAVLIYCFYKIVRVNENLVSWIVFLGLIVLLGVWMYLFWIKYTTTTQKANSVIEKQLKNVQSKYRISYLQHLQSEFDKNSMWDEFENFLLVVITVTMPLQTFFIFYTSQQQAVLLKEPKSLSEEIAKKYSESFDDIAKVMTFILTIGIISLACYVISKVFSRRILIQRELNNEILKEMKKNVS